MSHVNADFDALASIIAARKLYPDAVAAISDKQSAAVKRFMAIYRDKLDLAASDRIDWEKVRELILVDVASLARIGELPDSFSRGRLRVTVIDHHPPQEGNVRADEETIEQVGAAVTLLVERIRERSLPVTPFEATLFGLGIYSDTGSFSYSTTTHRDLEAAGFLLRNGMNLEIIQRFTGEALQEQQQAILNSLLLNVREFALDGLRIIVSTHRQPKYEGGLAAITSKLKETLGADAAIAIVEMQKRVYLVCRAGSKRIHFQPLLAEWGGGGHAQAGSANIRNASLEQVFERVCSSLHRIVSPAVTARLMMSAPVKTIPPHMTIEEAAGHMYRYGHTGFPVEADGRLVGIISRRDVDKANHHGLGHAPVKAFMSTNVVTIAPDTSLEEIQNIMIRHNIGRLPVLEDGRIIGIVSRTNVIEMLHNESERERLLQAAETEGEGGSDPEANGGKLAAGSSAAAENLAPMLERQLSAPLYSLLKEIGGAASRTGAPVYLIGGIVRDLLLELPNEDVDLVVEGDGIAFARALADSMGGEVTVHDEFGTATWDHPSGLRIDIVTSRNEYYDHPAALPQVEFSNLREDLSRRDFTINAMAICLNVERFGQLMDPFFGREDLRQRTVRVLHNLSFVEDPTRILRAVRFELRFDFRMDPQTEQLALASRDQLAALSAARINHELEKLFAEVSPARAIRRLEELRFWSGIGVAEGDRTPCIVHAEQLEKLFAERELAERELAERESAERESAGASERPGWFPYFLTPFVYAGQLDEARRFALARKDMKLLKEVAEMGELMKAEQWEAARTIGELHVLCKRFSAETLLFAAAGLPAKRRELLGAYVRRRGSIPAYLTGEDLIRQGLAPGPSFAAILLQLEAAVLNDRIRSREQALEWLRSAAGAEHG